MKITVVNVQVDRARRSGVAFVLATCVLVALGLQWSPGGLTGTLWPLVPLAGAFALAWRTGMVARVRAMMQVAAIQRESLAASEKLGVGDLEAAHAAYAALLVKARPLGGFHAVHVLMFGIVRFCEGHTPEGLDLVTRALESGWLQQRKTRAVLDIAEAWQVLMLLSAGDLARARERVDKAPSEAMITASLALRLWEQDWTSAVDQALTVLAQPGLPPLVRGTVAALGRFAAKQAKVNAKVFEAEIEKNPVGTLTRKNPALARFLDGPAREDEAS